MSDRLIQDLGDKLNEGEVEILDVKLKCNNGMENINTRKHNNSVVNRTHNQQ